MHLTFPTRRCTLLSLLGYRDVVEHLWISRAMNQRRQVTAIIKIILASQSLPVASPPSKSAGEDTIRILPQFRLSRQHRIPGLRWRQRHGLGLKKIQEVQRTSAPSAMSVAQ